MTSSHPAPTLRPIDTLLIANRGEIALRIARSARARGQRVIMVFTDADQDALHRRGGDLALRVPDYLDGAALIAAAEKEGQGTTAIHPGYGFLAENAAFAQAVLDVGLVWVGPPPAAIAAMGDKVQARRRVQAQGVPVAAGAEDLTAESLVEEARRIGFPVLVKASAGGGGKGMRVVEQEQDLVPAIEEARRLAAGAFGDDRVFLERYLRPARHVEVQVLADAHGTCLHLFERDCSVQRRHQKVIEEAPAPGLREDQRQALYADALRCARAVGYQGAGTVEFILGPDGRHFFLEMNTRLQVEHPVTEAITGLDLVELQLQVAEGRPLPLRQEDLVVQGWAIEARLYAEDADQGWLPSAGTLPGWVPPPGIRVDAGVAAGSEIGTRYDPLLAKLVAHGADREQARRRLLMGLERLVALGPTTSRGALQAILRDPRFVQAQLSTSLLEGWAPPRLQADWPALCALVAWELGELPRPLPELGLSWRNNRWRDPELRVELQGPDGAPLVEHLRWRERGPGEIEVYRAPRDERTPDPEAVDPQTGARSRVRYRRVDGGLELEVDGRWERVPLVVQGDKRRLHRPSGDLVLRVLPAFVLPGAEDQAGGLHAPMSGTVVKVPVELGMVVDKGTVLVVLEAMKMEQAVRAPDAGRITGLRVQVGDRVELGAVLVIMEALDVQD